MVSIPSTLDDRSGAQPPWSETIAAAGFQLTGHTCDSQNLESNTSVVCSNQSVSPILSGRLKRQEKVEGVMAEQDTKKFRAQYVAHHKIVSTIGGYDLIDVYFLLLVVSAQKSGIDEIHIPCFWLNQIGGSSVMTVDRVEHLSDLLEVKNHPENSAAKIVTGLTHKGVQLLKTHVKELSMALPFFSLEEDDIVTIAEG